MDGIRRYAGIDWAKDRHAVCVVDDRGGVVSCFEVVHTDAGLRDLVRRLEDVDGAALDARIVEQLLAYPDGHVFTSLPRSGRVPGSRPAGRDRRLPGTLPDARVAGLPGRGGAVHAAVGPASRRDLPLYVRQEAARRDRRHVIWRCWPDGVAYDRSSPSTWCHTSRLINSP
jgi:hypothetical protein